MGLYADWEMEKDGNTLLVKRGYPDVEYVDVYELVAKIENRTNCYCCTCGDREGDDAACRNHGYYAQRPCDIHGFPGQPWEKLCQDDEINEMPEPVSVYRERMRILHAGSDK